jgi:Acyl-CoA dehydrogenase, C-terminal domain
MDAFRTEAEIVFRRKARDYFVTECGQAPSGGLPPAERIWRDLVDVPAGGGAFGGPGCPGLNARVLAVDEAARRAPRLGRELIRGRRACGGRARLEERLLKLSGLAGTAVHVLEEGTGAARAQGVFASSLMGFRSAQERLASLAVGAEFLRLGALRVCRLVGRGEEERGEAELEPLLVKGRELYDQARSLALELLGEDWMRDRLPDEGRPHWDERT